MSNDSHIYALFHDISKLIIVFSVIVLIGGILLKPSLDKEKKMALRPTITPTIQSQSQQQFDSKSSYKCSYADQKMSVVAYFKNSKIAVEHTNKPVEMHIIVSGDCMYQWQGNSTATKVCGLKGYMQLLDSLSQMKMVTLDSLASTVVSFINTDQSTKDAITKASKHCTKEEVPESVFSVPKMSFKEVKLNTTLK